MNRYVIKTERTGESGECHYVWAKSKDRAVELFKELHPDAVAKGASLTVTSDRLDPPAGLHDEDTPDGALSERERMLGLLRQTLDMMDRCKLYGPLRRDIKSVLGLPQSTSKP